jgi:hypothetical protein
MFDSSRFDIKNSLKYPVGWVERSETQRFLTMLYYLSIMLGFTPFYPTYLLWFVGYFRRILTTKFLAINSTYSLINNNAH